MIQIYTLTWIWQRPLYKRQTGEKGIDNIKEDCTELGITIIEATKLAENQTVWRNTVQNC